MTKLYKPKVAKCSSYILPIADTLDVLSGKWKITIIASLFNGKKRFTELQKEVSKITPRMLSKELRELEGNKLVTRTVYNTIPASVDYELTEYGKTLGKVMDALMDWGILHREKILGANSLKHQLN
jgi:DNA-binding HxlR family transcriptional regulator